MSQRHETVILLANQGHWQQKDRIMTVSIADKYEMVQTYYCVYCAYNMTLKGYCVDCNEYKSAVTFIEYCQMNGTYPIYKGKAA